MYTKQLANKRPAPSLPNPSGFPRELGGPGRVPTYLTTSVYLFRSSKGGEVSLFVSVRFCVEIFSGVPGSRISIFLFLFLSDFSFFWYVTEGAEGRG